MEKTYPVEEIQNKWNKRWAEERQRKEATDSKECFTILMPPPNVTGVLHMGHALNNTLQDIYCRAARLEGKDVLWIPGVDHAGIATQNKVEKVLKQEGKTRQEIGYDAFIQRVEDWRKEHGDIIFEQLRQLGVSCNWERKVYTRDPGYTRMVMLAFKKLYDRGLIYKGKRLVNWCPVSRTALSDEEVIMKQTHGTLCTFRYEIAGSPKGLGISIATTRPETIMGDIAIAVHPDDPRYKALVGKHAICPFDPKRTIPIITDAAVEREFGTGALKITPAHDPIDFEIVQRYNQKHPESPLGFIEVLDERGIVNENGAPFTGMDRFQARKAVVEALKEKGLLIKDEPYEHNVGHSERADVPIEPRLSEQWFFHYPEEVVADAKDAVKKGIIVLIPEGWRKVYGHWLDNLHDWCISRQLWWGHRIPVWYRKDDPSHMEVFVDGPSDPENWEQDPAVLDTWFSSWLWPLGTLGYDLEKSPEEQDEFFKKHYPTDLLICGSDILFFWVIRMIMASLLFIDGKGRPLNERIPFKKVILHGIVRDAQGRKMSKSLGNSPDPVDLIKKYGADAVRLGLTGEHWESEMRFHDLNFDERTIKLARNLCTKLWNACRFRLKHGGPADYTRLTDCLDSVIDGFKKYKEWIRSGIRVVLRTPMFCFSSSENDRFVSRRCVDICCVPKKWSDDEKRQEIERDLQNDLAKDNRLATVKDPKEREKIVETMKSITFDDCRFYPVRLSIFQPSIEGEAQQLSVFDIYLLNEIWEYYYRPYADPILASFAAFEERNSNKVLYNLKAQLCDFYIEIQKIYMSPYGVPVMDCFLQAALLKLYPYIPYITSEIWEELYPKLGSIEANRIKNEEVYAHWNIIGNYLKCGNAEGKGSEEKKIEGTSCTYSHVGEYFLSEAELCRYLQRIVSCIRALKEQYPGRPGTQMVYFHSDDEVGNAFFKKNEKYIAKICGVKGVEGVDYDFIKKNIQRLKGGIFNDKEDSKRVYLFIEVDEHAADDTVKTQAQMDALRQHIQAAEQKLQNPQFLSQAPQKVQDGVKRLLEQNKQKLALLEKLQSQ